MRAPAWDETRVREAIAAIVARIEAAHVPGQGWPLHPLDRETDDEADGATALYYGAAGVIWALQDLQARRLVRLRHDYAAGLAPLLARHRAWLDASGLREPASLLMGETPILMMLHATGEAAWTEAVLARLVEDNMRHPSRELMWGAPGTLLAALLMHERTGRAPWADLFRRTADALWQSWRYADAPGCHYLPQHLYGRESSYLGLVHGLAGVALPLARGRGLLDAGAWPAWRERLLDTLHRTASHEDGGVNWRPQLFEPEAGGKWLMQICHGAPGIVVGLAGIDDPALDDLLERAGEAIWRAGPLAKGGNLCHGTAGNGHALLALFERTGHARWLERARAFAMHALVQHEDDLRRYGQPRCSLWTGDAGIALHLADCLRAQARFPGLDVF